MKNLLVDKCSTIMAEAINSLLTTGEVAPTVYYGKGEILEQVGLSFSDNPLDKLRAADDIMKHAAKIGAEYIIFISDSWVSQDFHGQPSLDPNRKEGIILSCQYKDISFVTIQEYSRTGDGQIILGDINTDGADSGIFVSLLPKQAEHVECNA